MTKKIISKSFSLPLKILFTLLLLGGIIFVTLNTYFLLQKHTQEKESLKKQNNGLIQEISNIRTFLLDSCQENNKLRRHLFLSDQNCSKYFPELLSDTYWKKSLEEEFITTFEIFFSDRDEKIVSYILQKEQEENAYGGEHQEKDFYALWENKKIEQYLLEFGFSLKPFGKRGMHLFKNGEHSADIFWDFASKKAKINLLQEKKILSISGISRKTYQAQKLHSQENRKKLLADLEDEQENEAPQENIILFGENEGNIDTIIFVSIRHEKEKILLLSIPRDLWVDTFKINAWYSTFGRKIFQKKIEEILGQKIKHYIHIDMLVFPKVIDAIGGIEYTFHQPLIDPSYKTRDGEQEGTLFFPKGKQNLNGIEALRVARSRKTSNDFSRAKRQQQILFNIREKMKQHGTIESVIAITPLFFQHVTTDLTPKETIKTFWKSRKYSISTGNVISTNNILVSEMYDLGNGSQVYILKPEGDDWNLIKKFVWSLL
jgi:LCP family protein required for cell wall assembly